MVRYKCKNGYRQYPPKSKKCIKFDKKNKKIRKTKKMKKKVVIYTTPKNSTLKSSSITMSDSPSSERVCDKLNDYIVKMGESPDFEKKMKQVISKRAKDCEEKHNYVHYSNDGVKKIKNKNKYQLYKSIIKDTEFTFEYIAWMADFVSDEFSMKDKCPSMLTMEQLVEFLVDSAIKDGNYVISRK